MTQKIFSAILAIAFALPAHADYFFCELKVTATDGKTATYKEQAQYRELATEVSADSYRCAGNLSAEGLLTVVLESTKSGSSTAGRLEDTYGEVGLNNAHCACGLE